MDMQTLSQKTNTCSLACIGGIAVALQHTHFATVVYHTRKVIVCNKGVAGAGTVTHMHAITGWLLFIAMSALANTHRGMYSSWE